MKKILGVLSLAFLMFSCDDGDIVVTDFAIEDAELDVCGLDEKVIFAVNNDGVYESISLILDATGPINDTVNGALISEIGDHPFNLDDNNRLIYRIYDGPIDSDYFCSSVPPSTPRVVQEFISGNAGTVTISVAYTDNLDETDDTDGDGVPNNVEGFDPDLDDAEMLDTDGDGIPDYLDIDDDGDNVLTEDELNPEEGSWEEFGFLDTDGDGTPDYLDADDDGDGVPTRNEVNGNDLANLDEGQYLNPLNYDQQDGIPDYLNSEFQRDFDNPTYIENEIQRSVITEVTISGFSLRDRDGNAPDINTNVAFVMGSYNSSYTIIYERNVDTEEDDEETEVE